MRVNLVDEEQLINLITELKDFIKKELANSNKTKRWLRTKETLEYLGISASQLESLKARNLLPYTKLGGVVYYDIEDIDRIMEENKWDVQKIREVV